eukprot:317948_1
MLHQVKTVENYNMIPLQWVIAWFIFVINDSKFIRIENLNALSSEEHSNIFTPNYLHENGKHISHDIHVVDKFGQFMKLSYKAEHHPNTTILKLDEVMHKKNVISLFCANNQNKSIRIKFKSKPIAIDYFNTINSVLQTPQNQYYITARSEWGCKNYDKNRNESIFRKVVSTYINESTLILNTTPGNHLDVFKELLVDLVTNIRGKNQHAHNEYQKELHNDDRRRLYSLSEAWSDVTETVTGVVDKVYEVVDDVASAASTAYKVATGQEVNFKKNAEHSFDWNYDYRKQSRQTGWYLSEKPYTAICTDCYVFMDLTYEYGLSISNYDIQWMYLRAAGSIDLNIRVESSKGINSGFYWLIPKMAVPEFGFVMAGIEFGLFLYGQVDIGFSADIDSFAYTANVHGDITKGVHYNAHDGNQVYYNKQNFYYDQEGPEAEFDSANVVLYIQPTAYLELAHVGDIYFGFQPRLNLALNKIYSDPNCAIHYVPSIDLLHFVGADLSIFNWHLKMSFDTIQSTLSSFSGCITQEQITRMQVGSSQYSYRRRSLLDAQTSSLDAHPLVSNISIDYFTATLNDFEIDHIWGNKSSRWYGNMSTVHDVCNDYTQTCGGYDNFPILLPNASSLIVSVKDHKTLIAVYHTDVWVTQDNGWDLANITIYTKTSCVARHELKLMNITNDIPTYNISLLEWYCDINLTKIGIDQQQSPIYYAGWLCMITLPDQMSAISIDSSFGNIMLFDAVRWCNVFQMTTKPGYTVDPYLIDNINWSKFVYPSSLWYGIWSCEGSSSARFNFIYYDYNYSDVAAILYLDWATLLFYGEVDLYSMTMSLQTLHYYEANVSWAYNSPNASWFHGIINILSDGTMVYSGSAEMSGCTGFVFQGYLNMEQFENITTVCGESGDFECNDGYCIPDYWICDGFPDCYGGEDEPEDCPPCNFTCNMYNTTFCVPDFWICDGWNDCDDASDEAYCPNVSINTSTIYMTTTAEIPTTSIPSKSTTSNITENSNEKQLNKSSTLTRDVMMFAIGMISTFIIIGVVFAVCKHRNKKVSPLNYQLMTDQL